jgi:hypothetical protein
MVGLTHIRPDGVRLVQDRVNLPEAAVVDLPLDGVPIWLVAAPVERGSLGVVVLDDERIKALETRNGSVLPTDLAPSRLPSGMPPVLVGTGDSYSLLEPRPDASTATHPI